MTPYYESDDGQIVLYNCDCADLMKQMEPGSVDCVVTDPPYGVNKACWDGDIPPAELWGACKDATVANGSLLVFTGLKYLHEAMLSIGSSWDYQWVFAWYKSNAMQFGKTGFNVLDLIIWYAKGTGTAKHKLRDVIECPIIPSANAFGHPTPKPVVLIEKLVGCVTDADDLVFDPFAGSGTTAIACIRTGRRFIGAEISEAYCEIAKQRIVKELAQVRMEL